MHSSLRPALFVLAAAASAGAQTPRTLTLAEAIAMAQEQGAEAKVSTARLEQIRSSNRLAHIRSRPRVDLSAGLVNFDRGLNPISLPDGSVQYVGQSNNQAVAQIGVSQSVALTGATVSLSTLLSRADQFGNLTGHQWRSTPVLLSFNQPLFQIKALEWDQRQSDAQLEQEERLFADSRAAVALNVANRYMALHKAQLQLQNARANAGINDTVLQLNEAKYRVGNSIDALELSRSELTALRARMAAEDAQLTRDRAAAQLALLIGLPETVAIVTQEPALPDTSATVTEAVIEAVGRTSVAAARFRTDSIASARALAVARATSRASATLSGSVGFNQTGTTLPLAYDSPLGKQQATLGLNLPIVQWGAGRAQVDRDSYAFQATLAASRRDVEQAKQDARFAARSLTVSKQSLRQATIADSIASTAFRIARLRYTSGTIDYTQFMISQREKDDAVVGRVDAAARFWNEYYTLKRLIGGQ
jgi:outer membrane protein